MAKNHQTENALFKALTKQYESEIASSYATLLIYFDNSVGIGEHPQQLEEMDKLVDKMAAAEDKLKTLNVGRYYPKTTPSDKINDDGVERHISPTAQDFYALFKTGTKIDGEGGEITRKDGTKETMKATLAPKDMAGVGLMAIKELIARIETLETEVAALKE